MKYNTTKVYGDCEGPLGFPMLSVAAKEVESIIAGLSEECKEMIADGPMRITKVADQMSFQESERADISLITTDSIDRDNEVLVPKGGDFKQFKRNPVVTFAHHYDELPVGRALWLKRHNTTIDGRDVNGWLAKTQYTTKPDDWSSTWFPDAVWHFVKSGVLKGKSIGFIPLNVRTPIEKEIIARPELANVRRVIDKWLALEYAIAPVPANPDTLVDVAAKAKSAGMLIPEVIYDELDVILMGESVPEVKGLIFDHKPEPVIEAPSKKMISVTELKSTIHKEALKVINGMDLKTAVEETIRAMQGKV